MRARYEANFRCVCVCVCASFPWRRKAYGVFFWASVVLMQGVLCGSGPGQVLEERLTDFSLVENSSARIPSV